MARIEASTLTEKEPFSKTAWIFPGQGTQRVGMGYKLYTNHPTACDIISKADEIVGRSLSKIMFRGPDEDLDQTKNAQPAIFTLNHAWLETLRREKMPGFDSLAVITAGHSLGEYNALVAAGALSFEDGLTLVQARAEAMQYACEVNPGSLVAVQNLRPDDLDYLTDQLKLEIAAFNTADQTVLGGTLSNIEKGIKWLEEKELRPFPLKVAGAFHTSLMRPAQERFAKVLKEVKFNSPTITVVGNVNAQPLTNSQEIRQELINQFTNPVKWQDISRYFHNLGITQTLEVGEWGILTRMNTKIIGGVVAGAILTTAGLTGAILWYRHKH